MALSQHSTPIYCHTSQDWMRARGAVELVIANIALEVGLFDIGVRTSLVGEHMFSAVVIMAVLTTLVTPILLKRIYSDSPVKTDI